MEKKYNIELKIILKILEVTENFPIQFRQFESYLISFHSISKPSTQGAFLFFFLIDFISYLQRKLAFRHFMQLLEKYPFISISFDV